MKGDGSLAILVAAVVVVAVVVVAVASSSALWLIHHHHRIFCHFSSRNLIKVTHIPRKSSSGLSEQLRHTFWNAFLGSKKKAWKKSRLFTYKKNFLLSLSLSLFGSASSNFPERERSNLSFIQNVLVLVHHRP